tara:strand:+ start:5817 stop:6089 length:273 start_codon:yes stop_codon:yes gene_type:complete
MKLINKTKDLAKNTGYFAIGTTVIAGIYVAKGSKRITKLTSYTIDKGKATFNEMMSKDESNEDCPSCGYDSIVTDYGVCNPCHELTIQEH